MFYSQESASERSWKRERGSRLPDRFQKLPLPSYCWKLAGGERKGGRHAAREQCEVLLKFPRTLRCSTSIGRRRSRPQGRLDEQKKSSTAGSGRPQTRSAAGSSAGSQEPAQLVRRCQNINCFFLFSYNERPLFFVKIWQILPICWQRLKQNVNAKI